jgi:4-aminobutyrate aminotransferase-like enzyme
MNVSALADVLAEQLLTLVPYLDKAFFAKSRIGGGRGGDKICPAATGRPGIIYCTNAFHGLTCGALSLNGDAILAQIEAKLLKLERTRLNLAVELAETLVGDLPRHPQLDTERKNDTG